MTTSLAKNKKAMNILESLIHEGRTDKQITDYLNKEFKQTWSVETIRRNRKKFGIQKHKGSGAAISVEDKPVLSTPPPGLDNQEKAAWFRNQFQQSHLFPKLQRQFEKHEADAYLEEYGNICCQFEDIVFSEFFQIDDYLKHRILIDRQLDIMKHTKEKVDEVAKWIEQNPYNPDSLEEMDPEERREYNNERANKHKLLDVFLRESRNASDRYDKLVSERQRIMNNLAATRKDRQDELRGGREGFMQLVVKLQNSEEERKKHGKYAELTKIAADDYAKEYRKTHELPDGSRDHLILDSNADFEDEL